jgi:hypothetical protein
MAGEQEEPDRTAQPTRKDAHIASVSSLPAKF